MNVIGRFEKSLPSREPDWCFVIHLHLNFTGQYVDHNLSVVAMRSSFLTWCKIYFDYEYFLVLKKFWQGHCQR